MLRAPVAVVHATTLPPFAYIGDFQTWVVPAGVTHATFDVFGGQGGLSGGLGGEARATIAVTPGDTIQIAVGGQPSGAMGIFPDGGPGTGSSGGGGGSSDIRTGACAVTVSCSPGARVIVAGAGGGGDSCSHGDATGAGGGSAAGYSQGMAGSGAGGTAAVGSAPGGGGAGGGGNAGAGTSGGSPTPGGTGGAGDTTSLLGAGCDGGGGGGGVSGGGGGGGGMRTATVGSGAGGGGGGGSSMGPAGAVLNSGVRSGAGQVIVSYFVDTAVSLPAGGAVVVGQPASFTATLSASAGGPPTGKVDFTSDGTPILGCTGVDVVGTTASCSASFAASGTHNVVAAYLGDSSFAPSSSTAAVQTVNAAGTTVSLNVSGNPVALGNALTLSAAVAVVAPGSTVPTGSVTFRDGSAVIGTAPLSGSAPATASLSTSALGAGPHSLQASYPGNGNAAAANSPTVSETVVPPPPPPSPSASPSAVPTHRPATRTPAPTSAPSAAPSATPDPVALATPSPSPSPSPPPIASVLPMPPNTAGPSGGAPPPLPTLIAGLPTPDQVSTSAKVIAENAALALLLMLLLAFPAKLMNAVIKANYADISRWIAIAKGRFSMREHLASRVPTAVQLLVFILISAITYAVLDPHFGLTRATGATLLGLSLSLLVLTCSKEFARLGFARRRYQKRGRMILFPAGLAMALLLVATSRLVGFQPGVVFGLFTGLAFRDALSNRDDGRALALACTGVLGLGVLAWVGLIPVKSAIGATAQPGLPLLVLATLLGSVWIAGIESILLNLVPLRFLDGEKVMSWSRAGWFALYGASMFAFVHTVLHPAGGSEGGSGHASLAAVTSPFLAFAALAAATWLFFRLRRWRIDRGLARAAAATT